MKYNAGIFRVSKRDFSIVDFRVWHNESSSYENIFKEFEYALDEDTVEEIYIAYHASENSYRYITANKAGAVYTLLTDAQKACLIDALRNSEFNEILSRAKSI